MHTTPMRGGRSFLSEEEKQNKPEITVALLKRIFSYLRPYWKQLGLTLLAIVVSSVFGILPTLLTGRIIDDGLINRDLGMLVTLIIISLVVLVISNLIGVLESYLSIWMAANITGDLRNQMYRHLQRMSVRFFAASRQGDIITRMTSDIDGVQSMVSTTLVNILRNVILLTVALTALFAKDPLLAAVGMVMVPLFILPTKRAGRKRWQITTESKRHQDDMNQIINETLSVSGQLLSKLFVNQEMEFDRYQQANRSMIALSIKESLAGRWFRVTMNIFTNIGPMLIYLAGGLLMIRYGNTSLTIGDITVMVALLGRMYSPVNQLLNIQVDLIRSLALFDRIFSYFDLPVEVKNAPDAVVPEHFEGHLSFEGVHFHYDEGQPVLKDISFKVEKGRSLAIVGPSGAGKSTIINLIPRLYDVTGGVIRIDGIDIRQLDLDFLRRNIGVVTQDTYLFNGTIRDNLLYAKAGASQEELEEACREAHIHDFISGLPDGYDTIVGNRGIKLSGGEKQRISIARIILRRPPLVIFDEATSSLDSISESLIQEAISPLLARSTSIVIAHRLSTVMAADQILVVDRGRVVESGRHAELLKQGGLYKELYETQFREAAAGEGRESGENYESVA
ncbi:MAG TPA: ABC transporter ATP-binding protein [Syntrophomonadaceae bacterium]|jgi:ATP-binding cassette subfamily B protein|nr:ABC transporter ATP-binding protein [Syntrophomonadaceae bacterium]